MWKRADAFLRRSSRNPQITRCQHASPIISIHTTYQPIVNHYCTFFHVMIFFYFTFLIILCFCSLILDMPCLYRQPTAKRLLVVFPSLLFSLSFSRLFVHSISRALPHPLSPSCTIRLSRFNSLPMIHTSIASHHPPPAFIKSIIHIISFSCRYHIIIGNNIPSVLMQYRYY